MRHDAYGITWDFDTYFEQGGPGIPRGHELDGLECVRFNVDQLEYFPPCVSLDEAEYLARDIVEREVDADLPALISSRD